MGSKLKLKHFINEKIYIPQITTVRLVTYLKCNL